MVELREWREDDAAALSSLLNNKKILDNLRDGIPYPYSADDALFYINSCLKADKDKQFCFAILCDGNLVGSIGIFRQDNIHNFTAEMGYYIAEDFWGRGIGTQAVKLAVNYVFGNSDIVRIYAEPFADNIGSCRVLEKNGFIFEGLLHKNAYKNGKFRDMKLYAKIK